MHLTSAGTATRQERMKPTTEDNEGAIIGTQLRLATCGNNDPANAASAEQERDNRRERVLFPACGGYFPSQAADWRIG
jgi:hypothetical protein